MTSFDKKYLPLVAVVMAFSGLGIFLLKEFFPLETEYGFRANPFLDEIKLIHNFSTFFFLFLVGKIMNNHITVGFINKNRKHRRSGITISALIVLLFFTGPLMFYITNESALLILRYSHLGFGSLFLISFIAHFLLSRKS